MSEKIKHSVEHHKELEAPKTPERLPDVEHAEPLRKGEKDPTKSVEAAREAIEEINEEDKSPSPMEKLKKETDSGKALGHSEINEELQKITLRRELKNIRRKLSGPDKALSSVIHQPAIRVASEAGAKTIARPSGLLGGGVTAFIGTSAYLVLANQMGFSYNYFVFIALFIIGFAVGLTFEILASALIGKKARN